MYSLLIISEVFENVSTIVRIDLASLFSFASTICRSSRCTEPGSSRSAPYPPCTCSLLARLATAI